MKKVCLDLHDFSVANNRFEVLDMLKDRFGEGFKVSLFTIPYDETRDWGPFLIREDLLGEVKKRLGWIQLIPHGLYHRGSEMFSCDYFTFKEEIIPAIKEAFFKDALPFVNGFCAPHWRWTEGVVRALDEEKWWGAVDRDKVAPCPKTYYRYNYLLSEPFWNSDKDVLKLHGHLYGTRNDVVRCLDNLLQLPKDAEWHFVTDFLSQ